MNTQITSGNAANREHAAPKRLDWPTIVARAEEIVRSYSTGVTLRQLHYRLVSEQLYPNTQNAYKRLSELTAERRRNGTFPDLMDRGRTIHQYTHFANPEQALRRLESWYRLDRTKGQDVSLYLGVEKAGIVNQLQNWFGDLGIPIIALGGYSSQSYIKDIKAHASRRKHPILLYGGDFDPSGEDIDRDFVARTDCWEKVVRVALTADQVEEFHLPPNPGKSSDSRAAKFVERHGRLVQVELDALDPELIRLLYLQAIDEYFDYDAYEAVLEQEQEDLARLRRAAGSVN